MGVELVDDDYEEDLCTVIVRVVPYGQGVFTPDVDFFVPDDVQSLDEVLALAIGCEMAAASIRRILERLKKMEEDE